MGQENGIAQVPFIKISLVGPNEVTVQTNCPPGHFFSMIESARQAMTQQFVKQESGGGILVPPPGSRIG